MKIIEIFGTAYLTAAHSVDMEYFFSSILNKEVSSIYHYDKEFQELRTAGKPYVIDLAGAHLCKSAMSVVVNKSSFPSIKFIDTENVYREEILRENERRTHLNILTEKLPIPKRTNDIQEILPSLKTEKVYVISSEKDLGLVVRWSLLISLIRPEIMLDIDKINEPFYAFASQMFDIPNMQEDSLSYCIGSTYYITKIVDNKVYDFNEGLLTLEDFVRKHDCVPGSIGRDPLAKTKENRDLVQALVAGILQFIPEPKTIRNSY